jgi:hypothetical protein
MYCIKCKISCHLNRICHKDNFIEQFSDDIDQKLFIHITYEKSQSFSLITPRSNFIVSIVVYIFRIETDIIIQI